MKKLIAVILVLVMVLSLAACAGTKDPVDDQPQNNVPENNQPENNEPENNDANEVVVMSYAEYVAAPLDSEVTVECYVQGNQSWWDNKITVYAADEDGAYFLYEMACSEEDAAKLLPGTKIRVTGHKGEWEGEVEIMEATFEFVEGADTYIAEAKDLTDLLGADELINYQNQLASFKSMTVESITYKNEGGDDIWLTLSKDGAEYSFTVEVYLTGPESQVYTTVGTLAVGDVIDVEGYLYWYQGSDVHVTAISAAPMSYAEYVAAELDSKVTVECYVQDHQSWWDNKITVYAADEDGAYFLYELACSEEDATKLLPGTKILVTGYKGEWEGEVEIMEATFQFVEGADTYIAESKDLTDLLGTEELITYQNQLATFKGMTVESITYKNEGGDDIWLTLSKDGAEYSFTVEVYLTGTDSEVYTTVGQLVSGDVVDVTGFLYWYQGSDVHVTGIAVAEKVTADPAN